MEGIILIKESQITDGGDWKEKQEELKEKKEEPKIKLLGKFSKKKPDCFNSFHRINEKKGKCLYCDKDFGLIQRANEKYIIIV